MIKKLKSIITDIVCIILTPICLVALIILFFITEDPHVAGIDVVDGKLVDLPRKK